MAFPTTPLRLLCLAAALALASCRPPPPVGRAADPTPKGPSPGSNVSSENAELLRKVDALQKELKDKPKSTEVKLALGRLYYEAERFLDATLMFRQVIDDDPNNVEARKMLGNCFFFVGNPDLALQMHEEVLRQNPNDVDSLFFRGAILLESKPQDKEALKKVEESWVKFLELTPGHMRRGELERQLEIVRQAIRGEIVLGGPTGPARTEEQAVPAGDNQGVMGGASDFQGGPPAGGGGPGPRFKKGTRVPALAANASNLERRRAEALDALDEGRFFDAKTAAEAALQEASDDAELNVAKARAMTQLGEAQGAIRLYGEVIKKNPKYSPAWHYLGMAHMMGGDPKRAAQTWRELMEFDPGYASQHRLDQRAQMAERMARNQGQ
ncbi:MAG: tetratricopeptide repeat protein [Myxococcota bacterium]